MLLFSCSFQFARQHWHLSLDHLPHDPCKPVSVTAQLLLETHTPSADLLWIEADYPQLLKSLDLSAIALSRCSQIAMVLFIGEHGPGGCTYAAIEARLGISNAAASRSVNSLSASARHRKTEPMGLVEVFIDPEEGRRYRVRLTKKGLTLMRALDQL